VVAAMFELLNKCNIFNNFTIGNSTMKNTTKLKLILQLFSLSLEMDEEETLHFTLTDKRTGERKIFIDKSYSVVVQKGFVFMKKKLKE
jgi:hypothetical protein